MVDLVPQANSRIRMNIKKGVKSHFLALPIMKKRDAGEEMDKKIFEG